MTEWALYDMIKLPGNFQRDTKSKEAKEQRIKIKSSKIHKSSIIIKSLLYYYFISAGAAYKEGMLEFYEVLFFILLK